MGGKRLSSKKWLEIENEYVETDISQRDLAEKHKISHTALRSRAEKIDNNWQEKRAQYRHKISTENEKLKAVRAKKEAAELERIREEERKYCDFYMKVLADVTFIDSPSGGKKVSPKIEPKDVKSLTASLKSIQDTRYKSYGIADKHSISAAIENREKENRRDDFEPCAERTAKIMAILDECRPKKAIPNE